MTRTKAIAGAEQVARDIWSFGERVLSRDFHGDGYEAGAVDTAELALYVALNAYESVVRREEARKR